MNDAFKGVIQPRASQHLQSAPTTFQDGGKPSSAMGHHLTEQEIEDRRKEEVLRNAEILLSTPLEEIIAEQERVR